MKRLLSLIVLLILALPLLAQDQGFESYVYQANSLCEFQIILSTADTGGRITYRLTLDNTTTTAEGTLGANDSVEMRISVSGRWYVLVVEREAADKGLYSVDSGLACGDEAMTDIPPPPSTRLMETLKPALDAMKTLLQDFMKTP